MEKETAKGMKKIGDELGAKFALGLGDNFYNEGVDNVDSHRFKNTFEEVFKNDFPFYFIAGNHDHKGNVSAQIEYTTRSKRWKFPSLYYTWTEKVGTTDMTIQFIMIDTVTLAGESEKVGADGVEVSLPGSMLTGHRNLQGVQTQMQWLEQQLKDSTADYVVVTGHFPMYSICEHGPTSFLTQNVQPLIEQYKATTYLNGHDHCAEMLEVNNIQYHTIGSAHSNDHDVSNKDNVPKDSVKFHSGKFTDMGGFSSVEVNAAGLTIKHYKGDGHLLYTAPTIPPRNVKQVK
jgi:tartrate-resistant acid phosphatase type 5